MPKNKPMSKPNDNQIYKGHTYKINRETGYVEIDGQPVTLINTDPHFWARQYIDKTEALMAAKATQPQPPQGERNRDTQVDFWHRQASSTIAQLQSDILETSRQLEITTNERDALQAQRDELLAVAKTLAAFEFSTVHEQDSYQSALRDLCKIKRKARLAIGDDRPSKRQSIEHGEDYLPDMPDADAVIARATEGGQS